MSSCGTEPYRPRRSFSSPIISSLHVQPLSFTSRKAKSPASGTTSLPGVPHAPSTSKSATASLFMRRSLKTKPERRKQRHLIPELYPPDLFEERQLDRKLKVDAGPGSERPIESRADEMSARVRDGTAGVTVRPFAPIAEREIRP